VLGEGAYLLVLETAAAASARGVGWYGELLAAGATSSDCGLNEWSEDPADLARCMRSALDRAGMSPADVSVVFASANSTERLDRVEARAIADVFGARRVPVVSIKGAVGEFGAVGAASMTAALACLERGVIPPTVGCDEPDADLAVDVVPAARQLPAETRRLALVNSFASGGANYSILICGGVVP
jgi:3-oxoacyl-[acyl-carrier-protein] synthase II